MKFILFEVLVLFFLFFFDKFFSILFNENFFCSKRFVFFKSLFIRILRIGEKEFKGFNF